MLEEKRNKLSVIRITWGFPPSKGGSISHILELTEKINPFLEKQTIITRAVRSHSEFDLNVKVPVSRVNVRHSSIPSLSIIKSILFAHGAIKAIAKDPQFREYDIVHVHGLLIGGLTCAFNRLYKVRKPIVVMIHGIYPHKVRPFSLSYYLEKPLLRFFPPDHILLLDDGTDIDAFSKFLAKLEIPFSIVYHGIDTDFFKPNETGKNRSTDPDEELFTILFPHRPIKVKQPELALQIISCITDPIISRRIRFIMLAAKDNDFLCKVIRKHNLENKVQLIDKLDNAGMRQFYCLSDIVIGTSLESNMGRAIQEAMACEKPVIVFNCGGIENLITDKYEGILVENGNVKGFSQQIINLCNDPKKRELIGKNARCCIMSKRNWNTRIEKELSIYDRLANHIDSSR